MKKKAKRKRKPRKLREPIENHLGVDLDGIECVSHNIKPVQYVNLQRIVDRWAAESEPPARVFGYSATGYFTAEDWLKYLVTDKLIQAPVQRAQMDSGPDESLDC